MPSKHKPKTWKIPLMLTDKDVDSECTPNRVIRSGLFHMWAKFPTVTKDIKYRLGISTRKMWEAKWYSRDALVDTVTGQLYVEGKCQSGDQWVLS